MQETAGPHPGCPVRDEQILSARPQGAKLRASKSVAVRVTSTNSIPTLPRRDFTSSNVSFRMSQLSISIRFN